MVKTETLTLFKTEPLQASQLTHLKTSQNLLIQVFTALHDDLPHLQQLLDTIHQELPFATVIGATTDGEIESGNVYTNSTVIAFSSFEVTQLSSTLVEGTQETDLAQQLVKNILTESTKLIITFSNGTSNGEAYLSGIHAIAPDTPVAGGMAGDNATFKQTYVIHGRNIIANGAVGVSLNSDQLQVETNYSFEWQPLGKAMTVTKVKQNRVYEIDHMPATKAYGKYLGKEIEDALPNIGIEFPLLLQRNGHFYARAAVGKFDDGSLVFAGNLNLGDKVSLGFADINQVLHNSLQKVQKYTQKNIETFFLYSCMARRRFMSDIIHTEIEPYAEIAPTAGFFTYGEFYHHKGENYLFNETLTFVALSENIEQHISPKVLHNSHANSDFSRTFRALSHLFKTTQKEYEFNQELLNTVVEIGRIGYFVQNHIRDSIHFSGIAEELFGVVEETTPLRSYYVLMVLLRKRLHPNDRKNVIKVLHEASKKQTGYELTCRFNLADNTTRYIKIITHLNFNSEGVLERTVGTIYDLSELKKEQERHAELSFLVENTVNEVYVIDTATLKYLYVNTKAVETLGFEKEKFQQMDIYDINPEITTEQVESLRTYLEKLEVVTNESLHRRVDGSTYPTRSQIYHTHYFGSDAYVIFSTDITKEREREANEQALKETLENVLDYSSTLFLLTRKTKMVHANKALLEFFGVKSLEQLRQKFHCVMDIFEEEEHYFSAKEVESDEKGCPCISTIKDKDILGVVIHAASQQKRVLKLNLSELPNESFLISMTDVTEIEQQAKRFEYEANHDKLTGAYNRSYLEYIYQKHLDAQAREGTDCAFILLDIDDFKLVNDNYGHLTGDRVLILLSNIITHKIRRDDVFVRWGGEEFLLLLPQTSQENAIKTAEILRMEISKLDIGIDCKITSSFGVTGCRKNDTKETLFERLDQALYAAKRSGKNRVSAL